MRRDFARILPVSAAQSLAGTRLLGGPLRLVGWSLNDGVAGQTNGNNGTATAPAAGATITSLSLANGTYQFEWSVGLIGAPAAADINNFEVTLGGTTESVSENPDVQGVYPQETLTIVVTGGPLTVAIKAVGAGTAGVEYTAAFTCNPVGLSSGVIKDGGMQVATVTIQQGGDSSRYMDEHGIGIETDITVATAVGTITGALWYYLESDYDHPTRRDHDRE
jgi:hypothetical protein